MKNYFIIFILLYYGFVFCNNEKTVFKQNEIRDAVVAGQFYPEDPIKLKHAVDFFLNDSRDINTDRALGIVVPHAGYIYSGQVAADAYKNVKKFDYEVVIILGTNHTSASFSDISVYPGDGFRTPLGIAKTDKDFAKKLIDKNSSYKYDYTLHEKEHSIEVQLPFLQRILPSAKIVPIVIGSSNEKLCRQLARDLTELMRNKKALIVASSDLSHYPKFIDALAVDKNTCSTICTLETESFFQELDKETDKNYEGLSTCACGKAPILTLMYAMKELGVTEGQIISYMNSGFSPIGKSNNVVGYASIIFSHNTRNVNCNDFVVKEPVTEFILTGDRKKELLKLARNTINYFLNSEILPFYRDNDSFYNFRRGVFVTLHKNGQLRGCIGHMAEDMTLKKVVQLMAVQSALYDRRFPPVNADEIDQLEIEISILTPYQRISDVDEITLGIDGVLLQKDNYSSVYLPQVATETGWSKKQFLEQLSLKAGLQKDAYKTAELSTFQALIFSEHELSGK